MTLGPGTAPDPILVDLEGLGTPFPEKTSSKYWTISTHIYAYALATTKDITATKNRYLEQDEGLAEIGPSAAS